jgi:para-nitrobenzyl esterase
MYEFRGQTALPTVGVANGRCYLSFPQGAAHSYDLQYVYHRSDLGNDGRRQLQAAMTTYWRNFAKTGNPNTGSAVAATWPAFTGAGRMLALDVASGGGVLALTSYTADHKCNSAWPIVTF